MSCISNLSSPPLPAPRSPEHGQRGRGVNWDDQQPAFHPQGGWREGQKERPGPPPVGLVLSFPQGRDSTYLLFFSQSYKNIPHHHPRHLCITVFPSVTKPGSPSPFTKPRPCAQGGRCSNTLPASMFPTGRGAAGGAPGSQPAVSTWGQAVST